MIYGWSPSLSLLFRCSLSPSLFRFQASWLLLSRGILLAVGLWIAATASRADYLYFRGWRTLDIIDLQKAATMFPYNLSIRKSPPMLWKRMTK